MPLRLCACSSFFRFLVTSRCRYRAKREVRERDLKNKISTLCISTDVVYKLKAGRNGQSIFTDEKSDVSTVENGRDETSGAIFRDYELNARSHSFWCTGGACREIRDTIWIFLSYTTQFCNALILVSGSPFLRLIPDELTKEALTRLI